MDPGDIVSMVGALATRGVLTAVWQSIVRPRKNKVDEAATLERLSAAFREEIRKENNELRGRMDKVVQALTTLTDVLDDVFPKIQGLTAEERNRLRKAN